MSANNLLAMEGGHFSPKRKGFATDVVARVSVDMDSLELGEGPTTPIKARAPPRRTNSSPDAITEDEAEQGFRDPPRRSVSLPQSPGDRHRDHFENLAAQRDDAPLLRMPRPPAQAKPPSPTEDAPEHLFCEEA
jgi:hypothetical protein